MTMLQRPDLLHRIHTALERSRVVALIGPRQCGKTTLARELVEVDSPQLFPRVNFPGIDG